MPSIRFLERTRRPIHPLAHLPNARVALPGVYRAGVLTGRRATLAVYPAALGSALVEGAELDPGYGPRAHKADSQRLRFAHESLEAMQPHPREQLRLEQIAAPTPCR